MALLQLIWQQLLREPGLAKIVDKTMASASPLRHRVEDEICRADHLSVEHHAINASAGQHALGAWHINNVNGYHSRLKSWLHRFNGVASSYLHHHLGWFRAVQRFRIVALTPSALLALAIGI